jgi:hypothetical protein
MGNNLINKDVLIATISAENRLLHGQVENLKKIVEVQKSKIDLYRQQIEALKEMQVLIAELQRREAGKTSDA